MDLTHQVLATKEVREDIRHATPREQSIIGELFHDLLIFFSQTYEEIYGFMAGPPLHDPVAVAVLLDGVGPGCIKFEDGSGERWDVAIVTDGLHSEDASKIGQLGRTIASDAGSGKGGVRIPRSIDMERFWSVIRRCLELADERVETQ